MARYVLAAVLASSVIWAAAALLGMTLGTTYAWPDFLHVDYGFPWTFATHTLNTIAGPVDRWSLDVGQLAYDLAFWVSGMLAAVLAVALQRGRLTTG